MPIQLPAKHPFRNVIVYEFEGKTSMPSKAVLIAPHKNEHPAVLPFQRKLADHLSSQGIKVEEKALEGSSERALSLLSLQQKGGELALFGCAQLLFLEDRLIRARLISKSTDKQTFVLELHAMRDVHETTAFPFKKDFQRIQGTKILAGKPVQGIWDAIHDAFEPYEAGLGTKDIVRVMQQAAEVRGISLKAAREELLEIVNRLNPVRNSTRFVELPAQSVPIPKSDPFHDIFLQREPNVYEQYYCSHTLQMQVNDSDVQKVAAIVRIPDHHPAKK